MAAKKKTAKKTAAKKAATPPPVVPDAPAPSSNAAEGAPKVGPKPPEPVPTSPGFPAGAVPPVVPPASPAPAAVIDKPATTEPPLEKKAAFNPPPPAPPAPAKEKVEKVEKAEKKTPDVKTFLSARARTHALAVLRQFIPDFDESDIDPIMTEISAGRIAAVIDSGEGPTVSLIDAPFFEDGVVAEVRKRHAGGLRAILNSQLAAARLYWKN